MIKHRQLDLSVIVASSRPKWLANCLYQLAAQEVGVEHEVVVVAEGDGFGPVRHRFPVPRYIHKPVQGHAGAFAKDVGVRQALGEYVCFLDDDNIYYPHAIRSLHESGRGHDIGIVRASIMGLDGLIIPQDSEIRYSNIDSMCLCVRRSLAVKALWSDHRGRGTDYYWVRKLLDHDPTIFFSDAVIGEHLN